MPVGDMCRLELLQRHRAEVRNDLLLGELPIPLNRLARKPLGTVEPCPEIFGHRDFIGLDQRAIVRSVDEPAQFLFRILALAPDSHRAHQPLACCRVGADIELEPP